jgi:hypothetical protein
LPSITSCAAAAIARARFASRMPRRPVHLGRARLTSAIARISGSGMRSLADAEILQRALRLRPQ